MSHATCPWCGYRFRAGEGLKCHWNGQTYCDRNCYELDQKFPPHGANVLKKSEENEKESSYSA